jgi:hypothetical protein
LEINIRSEGELVSRIKQVRQRNSNIQPYLNTRVDVVTLDPAILSPCQNYILTDELKKVERLRWDILEETGHVDILRLKGYVKCQYEDKNIDILPPVCEEYFDYKYGLKIIINDGMHRCYLAYRMGLPLNVVYVRGVSYRNPYYSYPNPVGWADVEVIDVLREGFIKKFHVAKEYKKLYRDFNSAFENVGDSRPVQKSA